MKQSTGFLKPLTHPADMMIIIAVVSYTSADRVCIAGVTETGEWVRLVNPYQRSSGNRFWHLSSVKESNSFNHIAPKERFFVWGKWVEPMQRGIRRQREDFIPMECQRAGVVSNLFSLLLPNCIKSKDFAKMMTSRVHSMFSIKLHSLFWSEKIENGILRFYGYINVTPFRNVYFDHPTDGSYQITDFSFFEQKSYRGADTSGLIVDCIAVFGISRIGKPLIVSIVEDK